ncbi:Hypothetical protein HVR_LOCUS1154 [uncultured virus]|nr:Hypothetical protein HVR_LOCUS1154 [uncultured virus]
MTTKFSPLKPNNVQSIVVLSPSEIIYPVQVNNNGTSVIYCVAFANDIANYIRNKFPNIKGYFPNNEGYIHPPGAPYQDVPILPRSLNKDQLDNMFTDMSKEYFKSTQPDEVARSVIRDFNLIGYEYEGPVTHYQIRYMGALGYKLLPKFVDNPLDVRGMVSQGHLILNNNEIYRVEREGDGYIFIFATPEIARFIYDKILTL